MDCIVFSGFPVNKAPENPDARNLSEPSSDHSTSNGVRCRTDRLGSTSDRPVPPYSRIVAGAFSDKKETKRGKAMHVGYTGSIRKLRGLERLGTSLPSLLLMAY